MFLCSDKNMIDFWSSHRSKLWHNCHFPLWITFGAWRSRNRCRSMYSVHSHSHSIESLYLMLLHWCWLSYFRYCIIIKDGQFFAMLSPFFSLLTMFVYIYRNGVCLFAFLSLCRGTSGIDIDLRRVDIDQCPQRQVAIGGVALPLNIFAGTDKCKARTTEVNDIFFKFYSFFSIFF